MKAIALPIQSYWSEDHGPERHIFGGIPTPIDDERYILYPGPLAHVQDGTIEWTPLGQQQRELGRLDENEVRRLAG